MIESLVVVSECIDRYPIIISIVIVIVIVIVVSDFYYYNKEVGLIMIMNKR